MAIVINGGFWDNEEGLSATYATRGSRQVRRALRLAMKGNRGRKLRELLTEVTGSAAGNTALASQKRIDAVSGVGETDNLGGVRPIETQEFINRATTAGDISTIDADIARSPQPTYADDASGNGGGGKLGY